MSKKKDMQRLIRAWKDETGETAIDMHKVAPWAVLKGWPLPKPPSPMELLAKQFADAGREEIEHDSETGNPYRVYHAVPVKIGQQFTFVYYDIREAPRKIMHKSLINRREQMIDDGMQLTFDAMAWGKYHPDEEPIAVPMDLTEDIQWRLSVRSEKGEVA